MALCPIKTFAFFVRKDVVVVDDDVDDDDDVIDDDDGDDNENIRLRKVVNCFWHTDRPM